MPGPTAEPVRPDQADIPPPLDTREALLADAGRTSDGAEPEAPPDAPPAVAAIVEPDEASVQLVTQIVGVLAEAIPYQGDPPKDHLELGEREAKAWKYGLTVLLGDLGIQRVPGWAAVLGLTCWTFGSRLLRMRRNMGRLRQVVREAMHEAATEARGAATDGRMPDFEAVIDAAARKAREAAGA